MCLIIMLFRFVKKDSAYLSSLEIKKNPNSNSVTMLEFGIFLLEFKIYFDASIITFATFAGCEINTT
jgi:hypothetical protein